MGTIASVDDSNGARRLRVDARGIAASLSPGDSVSVDGVCLTVERADAQGFDATAVAETLARTTLRDRVAGDRVNLERAATLARYFGGHLVQGHIDATARVASFDPRAQAPELVLDLSEDVFALCIDKGSIAVDGVSLTVAARGPGLASRLRWCRIPSRTRPWAGTRPGAGSMSKPISSPSTFASSCAAPSGILEDRSNHERVFEY